MHNTDISVFGATESHLAAAAVPGPEIHPADLPELRPVALPAGDAASAVTLAQCGSPLNAGQDLLYLRMFAHMYRTFLELPNGQC